MCVKWYLLSTCLLAAVPSSVRAEQATVSLVGGAKITAELLRENDQGVVLDLGHDVVQIPAKRVLSVDRSVKGAMVTPWSWSKRPSARERALSSATRAI